MIANAEKRVLVVDDDDSIRTMLAKIVERLDYHVETARDGIEAIEKIDGQDDFSVVLLDLMMPRADGFTVLRHMQEHHDAALGRTIVASAVPENEILKRFDGPIYKIHAKPFDIHALMEDIRACAGDGPPT